MRLRASAILFTAALLAASAANGQVWKVEFPYAPDYNVVSLGGPYVPGSGSNVATLAEMTQQHCKGKTWFTSDFRLTLTNPNPSQSAAPQLLGFSGFDIASPQSAAPVQFTSTGTSAPYICNFPKPEGVTDAEYPYCLGQFINHPIGHPQQYYRELQLRFHFNDVPFLNLVQNADAVWGSFSHPTVQLAIYEKNDCDRADPAYAGIGLASVPEEEMPEGNLTTIKRVGPDTWQIDVNQRVPVIVWGFALQPRTDRKGKTTDVCTSYMTPAPPIWTVPVKFRMLWTRQ